MSYLNCVSCELVSIYDEINRRIVNDGYNYISHGIVVQRELLKNGAELDVLRVYRFVRDNENRLRTESANCRCVGKQ